MVWIQNESAIDLEMAMVWIQDGPITDHVRLGSQCNSVDGGAFGSDQVYKKMDAFHLGGNRLSHRTRSVTPAVVFLRAVLHLLLYLSHKCFFALLFSIMSGSHVAFIRGQADTRIMLLDSGLQKHESQDKSLFSISGTVSHTVTAT